jgi:hypothetical protein
MADERMSSRFENDDKPGHVEEPDDERGSHNRLGYLNVDETDSSSERGSEEEEIAEDVDQPE